MRKVILAASVAALALTATPALAQEATSFTGTRVGVLVGTTGDGDKVVGFDDQQIGIDIGHDFDAGGLVVGLGAEYQTDLGNDFLDSNQTALLARVGVRAGSKALIYGTGGFTHASDRGLPFDKDGDSGYRIGAGVEVGGPMSFKLEQRYTDYGHGANGWQTVAGVNFRF